LPPAAEPILAEFRQCIGSLEQQAAASGPWAASHPDLRTPFESLTAGLSERLETSTVPCVVVDLAGYISDANAAMGQLLNMSVRCLRGKPLPLFIGEERARFGRWLQGLRVGGLIESAALLVRPRERRPTEVAMLGGVDSEGRITLLMCELPRKTVARHAA